MRAPPPAAPRPQPPPARSRAAISPSTSLPDRGESGAEAIHRRGEAHLQRSSASMADGVEVGGGSCRADGDVQMSSAGDDDRVVEDGRAKQVARRLESEPPVPCPRRQSEVCVCAACVDALCVCVCVCVYVCMCVCVSVSVSARVLCLCLCVYHAPCTYSVALNNSRGAGRGCGARALCSRWPRETKQRWEQQSSGYSKSSAGEQCGQCAPTNCRHWRRAFGRGWCKRPAGVR